jgi:hypothetical protein
LPQKQVNLYIIYTFAQIFYKPFLRIVMSSHETHHHHEENVKTTTSTALGSGFWLAFIIAALFICSLNFISAMSSDEGHGTATHHEQPAGGHGATEHHEGQDAHGAAEHGHEAAPEHH